jgi:uncharacterized repeat protein (TIGR02543 family)
MRTAVTKTTLVATAAAIGFSSLFLGAGSASAAPGCSQGATLLADNVCELRLTTVGDSTFTPTSSMSKLEVLLVAGGGDGSEGSQGYGGGGGGGEVKVVGFGDDTPTSLDLFVGTANQSSSVTAGTTTTTALPGGGAYTDANGPRGGYSGNGNAGWGSVPGGSAGGGAGASPIDANTGGAGVTAAAVAPTGSLFSNDPECFGGGGAVGIHSGTFGTASCGGGYMVDGDTAATIVAPTPNSGGGGAGGTAARGADQTPRVGASGIVVLRWVEPQEITVTFERNGHGPIIAPQTFLAGGTATQPAAPTEAGFVFNGWFTDAALTSAANFAAPITTSTTFYASWTAAATPATTTGAAKPVTPKLAATGIVIDPSAVPIGLAALTLGLGLVGFGARRARSN